jgi:hypothetical protein
VFLGPFDQGLQMLGLEQFNELVLGQEAVSILSGVSRRRKQQTYGVYGGFPSLSRDQVPPKASQAPNALDLFVYSVPDVSAVHGAGPGQGPGTRPGASDRSLLAIPPETGVLQAS